MSEKKLCRGSHQLVGTIRWSAVDELGRSCLPIDHFLAALRNWKPQVQEDLNIKLPSRAAWIVLVTCLLMTMRLMAGDSPDMTIIANAGVSIPSLSKRELSDVFLGRRKQWDDGTTIKLALLKDSIEQDQFLNTCTGRSPSQYWAHWRNILFSGSGIMPKVFATEQELLAYVAGENGAIGHVAGVNPLKDVRLQVVHTQEEVKP